MIHCFLGRFVGVGVGTLRRLRRPTVEQLERTALALQQLLTEEGLGQPADEVLTGAGPEADEVPTGSG